MGGLTDRSRSLLARCAAALQLLFTSVLVALTGGACSVVVLPITGHARTRRKRGTVGTTAPRVAEMDDGRVPWHVLSLPPRVSLRVAPARTHCSVPLGGRGARQDRAVHLTACPASAADQRHAPRSYGGYPTYCTTMVWHPRGVALDFRRCSTRSGDCHMLPYETTTSPSGRPYNVQLAGSMLTYAHRRNSTGVVGMASRQCLPGAPRASDPRAPADLCASLTPLMVCGSRSWRPVKSRA